MYNGSLNIDFKFPKIKKILYICMMNVLKFFLNFKK